MLPLENIVETVIVDLSDQIERTGAQINITTPLPLVNGDATLLGQIFLNLLDNALKYHRPGIAPQITISAERTSAPPEKMCCVQIADNGQGIPLEQQENVFNVFQRLHPDETYPGTGIGLALVAKAALLSAGTITLKSPLDSLENAGSAFVVRLPVALSPLALKDDKTTESHKLMTL